MRFLAEGPSIPDELLTARDQGRVVFFCGAGVSRARANMPDFLGLAEKVIASLGVLSEDPAREMLREAQERRSEIGPISVDRIFGLLEREFFTSDIQDAVARALRPDTSVDISAHQILMDLARGPEGIARLVTTNFDRLFECCDNSQTCWIPPKLPDLTRPKEFGGIIHLHGCVNADYQGSAGDGFVLSGREFGRAYLSDGWASRFIKLVLEKYLIVFVGYSADDPPVQYLLEALGSERDTLSASYAFQSGSCEEAEAKWRHKGVNPIAYNYSCDHEALWATLSEWAVRARDSKAWCRKVILKAQKDPKLLQPHERGQVAHLVSTFDGARQFAEASEPPPAEWICVFDPRVRYLGPGYDRHFFGRGEVFDPFRAYCLDTDPPPDDERTDGLHVNREIPKDVWDCFFMTEMDCKDLNNGSLPAIQGNRAVSASKLPRRLLELAFWFGRVSNQPASVWWASTQTGIHPQVLAQVNQQAWHGSEDYHQSIKQAWNLICEIWEAPRDEFEHEFFGWQASIKRNGFSRSQIRRLARICRPYLTVRRSGVKPPDDNEEMTLHDIGDFNVEYPIPIEQIEIPTEYLSLAVAEFRKNLELATELEEELGGTGLRHLCPIGEGKTYERGSGLSAYLFLFAHLFERLMEEKPLLAKEEFLAWRPEERVVFSRLRIWASGKPFILQGSDAGRVVSRLSDEEFWDPRHQRDLLSVLSKRWADYPVYSRKRIEDMLLQGPPRWNNEEEEHYSERRATLSLNRISWLRSNGCRFHFDVDKKCAELQVFAPKWKEAKAIEAAESAEEIVWSARQKQDCTSLLKERLDDLLDRAEELRGGPNVLFAERDPFAGMSLEKPVLALMALTKAAKKGKYPLWAWEAFLYCEGRKKDRPKFSALIAERISQIPKQTAVSLLRPIANWAEKAYSSLVTYHPDTLDRFWGDLIAVLRFSKLGCSIEISRDYSGIDWPSEAINSPSGMLANCLICDPRLERLGALSQPPYSWRARAEELLSLEGDLHRFALVLFSSQLSWLFAVDPNWASENLLTMLNKTKEDQGAFWHGFFWGLRSLDIGIELFKKVKPHLLLLTQERPPIEREYEKIPALLLAGWVSTENGERLVSSLEMREALVRGGEKFLLQTISFLKRLIRDEADEIWRAELSLFLKEIWPRQKKSKNPAVSARLLGLALEHLL